jgi:hypothetical protein
MTRKAFDAQASLVERLHGQRCAQISIGEDDELILDFGELIQTGPGDFDGENWLIVECPWRLDDDDDVLCGWEDTDETIGATAHVLIGATLESSSVRRPGFDLTLNFDSKHRIRIFPDCVAYFTDDTTSLTIPWYVGGKAVGSI